MKNYEAIKDMSVTEMTAMLYIFIKPFMDTFDMSKEQRETMREYILKFLNSEAGK